MIVLHAVVVFRRLRSEADRTAPLAQALFDLFFADMDENLREMGVGDLAVGKRIKAMAKGFYGRLKAYGDALDRHDDEALHAALRRNLFRHGAPAPRQVAAVADYMRKEDERLGTTDVDALLLGLIDFAPPPTLALPNGQG